MAKVIDLKHGDLHIDITLKVVSIGEVKEFARGDTKGKVCEAIVEDGSGQIKMSLWNNDVDKVRKGDIIKVINGYVSEFKQEPRLSTGKFGKLEVLQGVKLEEVP